MAWLGGWAKRVKFATDHTDIDETVTDFPTLLHLSASCGRNSEDLTPVLDELGSNDNRKKVAVQEDATGDECYVEVDQFDYDNEEAWYWSKVPTVHADSDDDLYLYFDSSHADNDTYVGDTNSVVAESVWDANFKAVYHMADGIDNAHIYDSTANSNDGTKKGANEPQEVAGQVGKAQDFDGGDDYVGCGNAASLNISDVITLTAITKIPATGAFRLIAKCVSSADNNYYLQVSSNKVSFGSRIGGVDSELSGDTNVSTDTWHQLTGVYDGSYIRVYLDGASDKTPAAHTGSMDLTGEHLSLGRLRWTNYYYTQQLICEARISDIVRTPAHIKATYETLWDDLLDWGSVEVPPRSFSSIIG